MIHETKNRQPPEDDRNDGHFFSNRHRLHGIHLRLGKIGPSLVDGTGDFGVAELSFQWSVFSGQWSEVSGQNLWTGPALSAVAEPVPPSFRTME